MTNANRAIASLLLVVLCGTTLPAGAIEPIPETAGWRGFIVGGIGHTDIKSNVIPGNRLIDLDAPFIASVNDPAQSDSLWHPVATGEINYTFDNRWQAFLGTSLEDAVTLDAVSQLGLRKEVSGVGTLQFGFLFSGIPTEVWEDPYAEGVRREDTDRESTGLRVQWDRVMGTALELTFSYRDVSIDTERSGEGVISVPCGAECQQLLRRDG